MAPPDAASRPLTGFEQVLLGVIADEPRSGYGLKRMFNASPASVYQPSPGALYPALRRLERRGLLYVEQTVSRGRRPLHLYHVTEAGRAAHLDWLRQPVVPATVASDLGLHLMRFALMENQLAREDVLAFLKSLADALDSFVSGMEQYLASGVQSSRPDAQLALEHGIAIHRASLQWTRSAMATLAEPASDQPELRRQGSGPGVAARPDRTKFVT
ncbi:MAG TPA: PadR family transcriptional regulator [Actinomycetes bacterium]|nr:PadR family transcriptional regulator [Actinomycetes bacterium]